MQCYVKYDSTFLHGNMRFSISRKTETPQPIKIKFDMIGYVGEISRFESFGFDPSARERSAHAWNTSFWDYFYCFLATSTCQTVEPIFTPNDSNDSGLMPEVRVFWA